jgi:hypothetical protein
MATGREVATNRDGGSVAAAINEVIKDVFDHPAKQDHEVWIATAYFNPGGFSLLAWELERVPRVRLLLGAEPLTQIPARQSLTTGGPRERRRSAVRRALEGHARSIAEDRDLLGFEDAVDANTRRLVTWLRSGRVEVKRYERGFLHGKAFIVLPGREGNGDGVVAGSSNFTYAGLALNDELNLGWYQPYVVGQVRDWFETIWDEAADFDLAAFYEERFRPHDPYETQLAGLLRTGLLKRFESSVHAFALTCERMAASHGSFLTLLEQGRVATGPALAEWSAAENDELEEIVVPPTVIEESFGAQLYDCSRMRADVEADRDLLRAFAAEACKIERRQDPKLAALIEQLAVIVQQAHADAMSDADERDKRKVIVFSYYTDTVDWIEQHIADVLAAGSDVHDPRLTPFRDRVVSISGDASQDKTKTMWGFAPVSSQAPPGHDDDVCDLLISTDVLAEGVNLQQARHIINYDLPWNPMRLVQRHGRIDRIGSPHERVFIRCFFPDRGLDRILRLEERLKRKLTQAAKSVGVESETLPGSKVDTDVIFSETREEIERLRRQDPTLFERGGEGETAYSGEEYRQELRRALQDAALADRIKTLPWGAGSGQVVRGSEPGFVFCVRVGNHPQAIFRWVGMADVAEPRLVNDTLACLAHAHARADTERVLSEDAHRLAYSAWVHARRDMYESWTRATDPANLLPEVPRAMRDAVALLTNNTPAGMTRQRADELAAAISAPYPPRIQSVFRTIVRTDASDQHKANRIAEEAERLGLEPSPLPEPLPIIGEDDIHLVCWMAIAAEAA